MLIEINKIPYNSIYLINICQIEFNSKYLYFIVKQKFELIELFYSEMRVRRSVTHLTHKKDFLIFK